MGFNYQTNVSSLPHSSTPALKPIRENITASSLQKPPTFSPHTPPERTDPSSGQRHRVCFWCVLTVTRIAKKEQSGWKRGIAVPRSSEACRNIPHRFWCQLLYPKSLGVPCFHGDGKLHEPSLFIAIAHRAEEELKMGSDKEKQKRKREVGEIFF